MSQTTEFYGSLALKYIYLYFLQKNNYTEQL